MLKNIARDDYDVVLGVTCEKRRLHHLLTRERGVADLDPGFPLEIGENVRSNVVRPIVDIQLAHRRMFGRSGLATCSKSQTTMATRQSEDSRPKPAPFEQSRVIGRRITA